ncbi:MAG: FecR domain-containing protein [Alphaproteobacteria bacterium]|nr:FecR domain-containing protein [Alphaproteobacteria bacterium]
MAISALAVLAFVSLGGPPADAEVKRVGWVVQQVGAATSERAGHRVILAIGASVYRADVIRTAEDGRVKVEFADGTIVAVGGGGELVVAEYAVDGDDRLGAILSLLRGIIRATVAAALPSAEFEVETRAAVASVRSTDFMVEAEDGHSAVVVLDGRVAVAAGAGAVVLGPGEGTDVDQGASPTQPKSWGRKRVDSFIARTRLP